MIAWGSISNTPTIQQVESYMTLGGVADASNASSWSAQSYHSAQIIRAGPAIAEAKEKELKDPTAKAWFIQIP